MLTDGWPPPPLSCPWASLFCSKSGFITKTHFGRSLSRSPAPLFYGCEFFSVSASCNVIGPRMGERDSLFLFLAQRGKRIFILLLAAVK